MKTLVLAAPDWPGHRAGQHVDIRLTAEDGYQAQRSYSIASSPEDGRLALTVERLEDGEVSPYLADELVVGDKLELRGPIGGYFVWEASEGGPVLLVGGGSGVVPLMAMIRAPGRRRRRSADRGSSTPRRERRRHLPERARGARRAERRLEAFFTLTRDQPSGWKGYGAAGRPGDARRSRVARG